MDMDLKTFRIQAPKVACLLKWLVCYRRPSVCGKIKAVFVCGPRNLFFKKARIEK
uniref:Uncharacterized protein n=1 Tax=Candidatus Kentrum sp. MB TaxID=2138164 RepID=A0A450XJH2_9GAMM|nr:MAG: hypothetical protein BECKMB1821G_GA0114241_10481 [Candidatus Kentron sp. MB]VFK33493.1 MAG: hypothetical protein BECKMB1821I_GA0114274_10471 [Candidatus Kentron sp. MB]VFK76236.1 MAG: hypothetical protein BECKMB1821H_GA0114242_10481 [Candidatus Kentron sp. MB]